MQTTTITRNAFLFDGPSVVERSRGTAHPTVPTTRPVLGARRGDALLDRR
jgi:hypothetical protein